MVYYNPKVWFALIFHSYSRYVMRKLMPALLFLAAYTAVFCYLVLDVFHLHEKDFHSTLGMHSLLGIVLGLFLVFRTNTAYDRWWEGRKLWGSLVNNTRNLSHKLSAFLSPDDQTLRKEFCDLINNLVTGIRENVRQGVDLKTLDGDVTALKGARHVPNVISSILYQKVNKLYTNEVITGDQLFLLDKELKEFSDIMGAIERIKNTPIPYSYSMYIKKFIFIFIITLPFAFVMQTEYMTIPIVVLTSFVILSVELIAEEIEDPFGKDINDLPSDELSAKIKDNVREILRV